MKHLLLALALATSATGSASAATCIPAQTALSYVQSHGMSVEIKPVGPGSTEPHVLAWRRDYGDQVGVVRYIAILKRGPRSVVFVGNEAVVCGPL